MAHTLTITDGTTTIDLAATGATGIALRENVNLPPLVEVFSRVGTYPFADGQRTIARGLSDRTWEIPFLIGGADVVATHTSFVALNRLLRAAITWQTSQIGVPVRLTFKPDGASTTAYATITSVPLMPATEWGGEANIDTESANAWLHGRFQVTLEPMWHAGAATQLVNDTSMGNQPVANPDLNYATASAATGIIGDMAAPFNVVFRNTTASRTHDQVWLALLSAAPELVNYQGTLTDTYDGTGQFIDLVDATPIAGGTYAVIPFTGLIGNRHRGILRALVHAGDPDVIQFRLKTELGGAGGPVVYGPWVPWSGSATLDRFWLLDLGAAGPFPGHLHRQGVVSGDVAYIDVEVRSLDGTAAEVYLSYFELLPTHAFVKLDDAALVQNAYVHYEQIAAHGSYEYARQTPQAYVVTSAGAYVRDVTPQGRLPRLDYADVDYVWAAALTTDQHFTADTFSLTAEFLPSYALGLRGIV